ncbi:MAG: hypothetical protein QNJ36_10415 [Calothrix sp. MO_167.B42]|nr:hypothetical protein [Calothrix sp. MO_167.B42]
MSLDSDLNRIFGCIANGEATEGDMQTLRQLLNASEGNNSIQIGKCSIQNKKSLYIISFTI